MARPSPAVNETAHVADSQRSFGLAVQKQALAHDSQRRRPRPALARRRTQLCETPSTLIQCIAVRSFERLAKDYGLPSKRTTSYLRSSERKSSDSANQNTKRQTAPDPNQAGLTRKLIPLRQNARSCVTASGVHFSRKSTGPLQSSVRGLRDFFRWSQSSQASQIHPL